MRSRAEFHIATVLWDAVCSVYLTTPHPACDGSTARLVVRRAGRRHKIPSQQPRAFRHRSQTHRLGQAQVEPPFSSPDPALSTPPPPKIIFLPVPIHILHITTSSLLNWHQQAYSTLNLVVRRWVRRSGDGAVVGNVVDEDRC